MVVVAWLLVVYVILSLLFICSAVYTDDDKLFLEVLINLSVVTSVVVVIWIIYTLAL